MHRRHRFVRLVTAVAVATGVVAAAGIGTAGAQKTKELAAATINGSGATFPQGYYDECRESFKEVQPNLTVNYPNPGGGSGKGRQDFADQVTQWGATDAPYPAADLTQDQGRLVPLRADGDGADHGVVQRLRRHQAAEVHAGDAGEDLPGRHHDLERRRRSRPTTRA